MANIENKNYVDQKDEKVLKWTKGNALKAALALGLATTAVQDVHAETRGQLDNVLDNKAVASLDSSSYTAWVEHVNDSQVWVIEYKKEAGNLWAVVTLKWGKYNKSALWTMAHTNWDVSSKATAGFARIGDVNQGYVGAEVNKKVSKNATLWAYANATTAWDTILSSTDITEIKKEPRSAETTFTKNTTEELKWLNTATVWVQGEYFINQRNKVSGYAGATNMGGKWGPSTWVAYEGLSGDNKTKYGVSYDYEKTSNFGKQEFTAKVERIVAPEVAVWVKWVHTKVDGRKSDNAIMATVTYTPGQKEYSSFKPSSLDTSHAKWAESAMRTVKAKKVVKETAASSTTTLNPEMENDTSSRNTIYKKEVRNVNWKKIIKETASSSSTPEMSKTALGEPMVTPDSKLKSSEWVFPSELKVRNGKDVVVLDGKEVEITSKASSAIADENGKINWSYTTYYSWDKLVYETVSKDNKIYKVTGVASSGSKEGTSLSYHSWDKVVYEINYNK